MGDKAKKTIGIILAVLLLLGMTIGFAFMGVVYGGYSFGVSLLIPLGAYLATAVIGVLVWLIVYLIGD